VNTAAPEVSRLAELSLAWLSTQKEGRAARSGLSKALWPYVSAQWTKGEWNTHLDLLTAQLLSDGLLTASGRAAFQLTPRGRARALTALGVEKPLRGVSWRTVKNVHVVARALGLPASREVLERLKKAEGLVALLIKRGQKLSGPQVPTLKQVQDRVLWQQLGVETDRPFDLKAVRSVLMTRALGATREQPGDVALKMMAAREVGAVRAEAEEIRLSAVRGWLASASPGGGSPPPSPGGDGIGPSGTVSPSGQEGLPVFVERVLAAARASTTGKFGDDLVFISHVYQALPELGLDEGTFKQRLLEANRARLLSLSRADLVEAMNPRDVAASEIRYLGATFHFIAL